MANPTLEQLIEAVRGLPPEDRQRLRDWLDQQEQQNAEERQREAAVREQVERYRKSMKWVAEHRAEYLGQWVVLDGDRLVSHGTDGGQVYDQAKAAGIAIPFLLHIVEEKEPFYAGWS